VLESQLLGILCKIVTTPLTEKMMSWRHKPQIAYVVTSSTLRTWASGRQSKRVEPLVRI